MASKKITDLTLRSDFDDTCNVPTDDASQTWRVTGAQIKAYAKAAIAPLTTLGDILFAAASGVPTRLAGNTTTTKKFATQTGTGSASAAPVWDVMATSDMPSFQNSILVLSPNGHGSTNTKIRKYSGTPTTVGAGITYTSSAANGDSFTINAGYGGLYHISIVDGSSAVACQLGVSVNSNQLTTNIAGITDSHRVIYFTSSGANGDGTGSVVVRLAAGDIVRAHGEGSANGTATRFKFYMCQIGN